MNIQPSIEEEDDHVGHLLAYPASLDYGTGFFQLFLG
jgi:hypothetical protein